MKRLALYGLALLATLTAGAASATYVVFWHGGDIAEWIVPGVARLANASNPRLANRLVVAVDGDDMPNALAAASMDSAPVKPVRQVKR